MPRKTPRKTPTRATAASTYVAIPIDVGLWGKSLTGAQIDEMVSRQVDELFKTLMEHYGISVNSSDKWRYLSWCLAEELGLISFEPPKGRRPRIWAVASILLIKRMDEILARGRLSTNAAAAHLINQYPEYRHLTPKSLVNRYNEWKARMLGVPLGALVANPEK